MCLEYRICLNQDCFDKTCIQQVCLTVDDTEYMGKLSTKCIRLGSAAHRQMSQPSASFWKPFGHSI